MSYSFNSEPRVVAHKSEKFKPEEKVTQNLMFDKRVFRGHVHNIHNIRSVLSPQEQEQLNFQKEKEKRQEEMMKEQLEQFKQSKVKQTPYDIRPAATARIEVDLQYFLTDHKSMKPQDADIDCQTDVFTTLPPKAPYNPKKTGIDAYSQVWDGDLFSFDAEVQPLLNVLTFKTLEQALLEVEEESELAAVYAYKQENIQCQIYRAEEWEAEVQKEIALIEEKKTALQRGRNRHIKTLNLNQKVEDVSIAKNFLSDLFSNTAQALQTENLYPESRKQTFHLDYLPQIYAKAQKLTNYQQVLQKFPGTYVEEVVKTLTRSRIDKIAKYKQRALKLQYRATNFSANSRILNFLYLNPDYKPESQFKIRLDSKIKNEDFVPPLSDKQLLTDEMDPDDSRSITSNGKRVEEEATSYREPTVYPSYPSLQLSSIRALSFAIANHPFLDTPKDQRRYGFHAEFYSSAGHLISSVDSHSSDLPRGVKVNANARDMTQKFSDDEKLVIRIDQLEQEVHSILLYIKTAQPGAPEMKYARYHLGDYEITQDIDRVVFNPEENFEGTYLAYRIYKPDFNPRGLVIDKTSTGTSVKMPAQESEWQLDIYNIPVNSPYQELTEQMQELSREGAEYIDNFTQALVEYRTRKLIEIEEFERQAQDSGSKRKKKKKEGKGRVVEPRKMAEYLPVDFGHPSSVYGPFTIDLEKGDAESLKTAIIEKCGKLFEGELEVLVKKRTLSSLGQLVKPRGLFDLKISKIQPEEPAPVEEEDN